MKALLACAVVLAVLYAQNDEPKPVPRGKKVDLEPAPAHDSAPGRSDRATGSSPTARKRLPVRATSSAPPDAPQLCGPAAQIWSEQYPPLGPQYVPRPYNKKLKNLPNPSSYVRVGCTAPGGELRVITMRANQTLVSLSDESGYIQRPFSAAGQEFVQRTYQTGSRTYTRLYEKFTYGVELNVYAPSAFFAPAIYDSALDPVWLPDNSLTPEVKQAIAEEARTLLALEKTAAESAARNSIPDPSGMSIVPMLDGHGAHVFIVSSSLYVTSAGRTCALSEGAVLQLNGPLDAATAGLSVLASRGQDCPKASLVALGIRELQEMQNDMRASIDRALAEMQKAPPTPAFYSTAAPTPASGVATQLRFQRAAAAASRPPRPEE